MCKGPAPKLAGYSLPHLVGRHQVQETRIHGVKLHDMVHGFPIGHCQHPPADNLHALVQADLWEERPTPTDARTATHKVRLPQVFSPLLLGWPRVKGKARHLGGTSHTLIPTQTPQRPHQEPHCPTLAYS